MYLDDVIVRREGVQDVAVGVEGVGYIPRASNQKVARHDDAKSGCNDPQHANHLQACGAWGVEWEAGVIRGAAVIGVGRVKIKQRKDEELNYAKMNYGAILMGKLCT